MVNLKTCAMAAVGAGVFACLMNNAFGLRTLQREAPQLPPEFEYMHGRWCSC